MDKSVALRVAKRFITLPLDKRKLYLEKMLEEGVSPANLPIPETRSGFTAIPLSYAQERQLVLWQMDPHSTAYHIPSALRLKGRLDVAALERSFNAVAARHESLRTVFAGGETPCQRILDPARCHRRQPLAVDHLRAVSRRGRRIGQARAGDHDFGLFRAVVFRCRLLGGKRGSRC